MDLVRKEAAEGSALREELIARYCYLLPHQYADPGLLLDISVFTNYLYDDNLDTVYKKLETSITTPEEDEALRREQFIKDLTPYEKDMLHHYYVRQKINPEKAFNSRNDFIASK